MADYFAGLDLSSAVARGDGPAQAPRVGRAAREAAEAYAAEAATDAAPAPDEAPAPDQAPAPRPRAGRGGLRGHRPGAVRPRLRALGALRAGHARQGTSASGKVYEELYG